MTTEEVLQQRIRSMTPEAAESLMTSLTRELEELRDAIMKKDRSRPDPKLLLTGKGAISQFGILAVAATRLRGKWPNAPTALDALESWRKHWNLVASAAIVHAKAEVIAAEKGSPEHERALKNLLDLVDVIQDTFRPFTGPPAKWLQVQADAIDSARH